jgi:hypothetical protein
MSEPDSSRWVANEWRSVWQLTCFAIPAERTASLIARCGVLRIGRAALRRKHELPAPLPTCARILARERIRQPDLAVSLLQVACVQQAHSFQMCAHRLHQPLGKHRHAILLALAVAHQDLAIGQIHVLDAQPQALQHTKPGAIQEARDQPVRPGELGQHALDFAARQDDRQSGRACRPLHAVEPCQLPTQHLAVEKEDRRERLVLRRRGHLSIRGKMIQERRHLGFAKHLGMPLAVEVDEAPDPVDVRLLRAPTVVARANRLVHALEQSRRAAYLPRALLTRCL